MSRPTTQQGAAEFGATSTPASLPTGIQPASRKSRRNTVPSAPEAVRERIAERRAFLTGMMDERSRLEGEFFRHTSRRAAITKAERKAGRQFDQQRQEEDARHLEALENTPVRTLADVAAVLDMLRRETGATKPTTRADRLRLRLMTSASAVTKDVNDALAWSWTWTSPAPAPVYSIPERAAQLMAAERQRIVEANSTQDPQRQRTQEALVVRATTAIRELPPEAVARIAEMMELRAVWSHAHAAMVRLAADDLDRQHIAAGLVRRLEELGAAVPASAGLWLTTSTIPSIGITFRQAADRVNELLTLADDSAAQDPDEDGPAGQQRKEWMGEQIAARQAIATTPAATMGDVLVKLEMLAHPDVGAGSYEVEPDDLNRLAGDLDRIAAGRPTVSPHIIVAYIDWQRSKRFSAAVQRATETATDEREAAALKAFREAAERTAWDVEDGVLHGETATMDDALLQLRLVLEMDDTVLSNLFSSGARSKLEDLARSQPLPELPEWEESRGRPVTDEDWRTYLTAHPDRMHEAAPADLLRLFEIEEGAEVFALWSGYARAAAGTDGDMEKARASIRAYGVLHDAMESRDGFSGGDVLTEDERAHLASMGHLPDATVQRLEAEAQAVKERTQARAPGSSGMQTEGERALIEKFRNMDEIGKDVLTAYSAVIVAVDGLERSVTTDGAPVEARKRAGRFAGHLRGQVEELEALAKGGDAFADAVSAVRAEGAGALSLPEAPSVAMVEAGATAAGISAEQMRAAYTAMVAAAQQERAA